MAEQNAQEVNPLEILETIRDIANMLDSVTLHSDDLDPVFIHDNVGEILDLVTGLLDSAKSTRQISSHGISFWLKFAMPIADVPEELLRPRSWGISKSELEGDK